MIEGGRPLHGTVRAAGNKNGALPILAATLLTSRAGDAHERAADPRRRDDARAARRHRRRRRVDRRERGPRRTRPSVTKHELDPELCGADPRVVPARRPAARALRPGHRAAAGRRRDRPPPPRPAHPRASRARRRDRGRRPLRDARRRAARRADLPRRGERDGHREHGDGGRRSRPGETVDRQRRLRAARPGSLPLPRLARRARSRGSARTCSRIEGVESLCGGEWRIGPDHIEVGELHRPRPRSPAATSRSRTSSPTDLVSILPAFERLGVAGRARAARACASRPGRSS